MERWMLDGVKEEPRHDKTGKAKTSSATTEVQKMRERETSCRKRGKKQKKLEENRREQHQDHKRTSEQGDEAFVGGASVTECPRETLVTLMGQGYVIGSQQPDST
mmetsp:Transcript_30314/g.65335  ORF Transcript_30314/g.65335 Transcript_30314/m.65335 type:complete len:105 (-) Transcript_30314:126-440(-)